MLFRAYACVCLVLSGLFGGGSDLLRFSRAVPLFRVTYFCRHTRKPTHAMLRAAVLSPTLYGGFALAFFVFVWLNNCFSAFQWQFHFFEWRFLVGAVTHTFSSSVSSIEAGQCGSAFPAGHLLRRRGLLGMRRGRRLCAWPETYRFLLSALLSLPTIWTSLVFFTFAGFYVFGSQPLTPVRFASFWFQSALTFGLFCGSSGFPLAS